MRSDRQSPTEHRTLVGIELLTGAAAMVGGMLLVVRPDGSLLHAKLSALTGSPFSDWRIPGLLLSTLVGGGLLVAGVWQRRRGWHARELSMFAGAGLIAFECAELAWIGFQPLEALFDVVGAAIFAFSRQVPRQGPRGAKTGAGHATALPVMPTPATRLGLDLYWIPLGAGARTVRTTEGSMKLWPHWCSAARAATCTTPHSWRPPPTVRP